MLISSSFREIKNFLIVTTFVLMINVGKSESIGLFEEKRQHSNESLGSNSVLPVKEDNHSNLMAEDGHKIPIRRVTTASSTLMPPIQRMLSRKKRVLLMPNNANLKATINFSKSLIARFPSGINQVIEMAFYYPTYSTRLDLIPKRLRKPTTTTPKPKVSPKPLFVCIPGSLICYKAKPAKKPDKVQRIDENIGNLQWISTSAYQTSDKNRNQFAYKYDNRYDNYRNRYNYNNFTKYKNYNYNQKNYNNYYNKMPAKWKSYHNTKYNTSSFDSHPQSQQWAMGEGSPKYIYRPTPASRWTKWTTQMPDNLYGGTRWQQPYKWVNRGYPHNRNNQSKNSNGKRRAINFDDVDDDDDDDDDVDDADDDIYERMQRPEFFHFEDLEPFTDWAHYHSHRDRRQLFHQFEGFGKFLGFDMRSCLVRAICESKRFLLPEGRSLIHDIVRLIFTLPTTNGMTDEYSRAMQADYETCDKFLRPKCQFNILQWLLKGFY